MTASDLGGWERRDIVYSATPRIAEAAIAPIAIRGHAIFRCTRCDNTARAIEVCVSSSNKSGSSRALRASSRDSRLDNSPRANRSNFSSFMAAHSFAKPPPQFASPPADPRSHGIFTHPKPPRDLAVLQPVHAQSQHLAVIAIEQS